MMKGIRTMHRPNKVWKSIMVLMFCLIFTLTSYSSVFAAETSKGELYSSIDRYIQSQITEGELPGVYAVIVHEGEISFSKGYGYANVKQKITPDDHTLFEMGSNTKAFTGLAILQLENEGLLELDDPVSEYLPWFQVQYKDRAVNVTIQHLLKHTSGIPYEALGNIVPDTSENALEDAVKTLINSDVMFNPGSNSVYSSMNYDVLGLIIESISGTSYEEYMEQLMKEHLGMQESFFSKSSASPPEGVATGYKLGFKKYHEYEAEVYRGNAPAAYLYSNASDIAKWMSIQLGTNSDVTEEMKQLIAKSHETRGGVPYNFGWQIEEYGNYIIHGGNNPNYASYIGLLLDERTGIAILGNANSEYINWIGAGVKDLIQGKEPQKQEVPPFIQMIKQLDRFTSIGVIGLSLISLIVIGLAASVLVQAAKKKRSFQKLSPKRVKGVLLSTVAVIFPLLALLYIYKNMKFIGLPIPFIVDWGPTSLKYSINLIIVAIISAYLYYLSTFFFSKAKDNIYFTVILFTLVSGIGNGLIIFIINTTVQSGTRYELNQLLFFAFSIILYIWGTRIVRVKLIKLTNDAVYEKRTQLVNYLSNTSYQKFERVDKGHVHAVLNNDTEVVSRFANLFVSFITSLVTLIFCFVYLGIINLVGLGLSVAVIALAAGMYFYVGAQASSFWEKNRDIQNRFYKLINDLISGFKELSMNNRRKQEFQKDMFESCDDSRVARIKGEMKFTNVTIFGELIFVIVIGTVVFAFPLLFSDITKENLLSYVFVFLYMTGPVNIILSTIPEVIQFNVSWKRINATLAERKIGIDASPGDPSISMTDAQNNESILIELQDVTYSHTMDDEQSFGVGPINCTMSSGEIVFITGGNGSGKSTLAKLITGLYRPEDGVVLVNGEEMLDDRLKQNYGAIYSDYYLFDKLYGVDYNESKLEIEQYLKLFQLDDKVTISEQGLSTVNLSTGQRKRLALLICYLEDRPVFLFDEWAADQDPEFRNLFYTQLLPELKEKGKCIIAITHDDHYFDVADKLIKMDMGKIVDYRVKNEICEVM